MNKISTSLHGQSPIRSLLPSGFSPLASPKISSNYSNHSTPRYGLLSSPNRTTRRLSTHVLLKPKLVSHQQDPLGLKDTFSKQDSCDEFARDPNSSNNPLESTIGEPATTKKSSFISKQGLDSYLLRSSERKSNWAHMPVLVTQGISEFETTLLGGSAGKRNEFKEKDTSSFIPREGDKEGSPATEKNSKRLLYKNSDSASDSSLDSALEKELIGLKPLKDSKVEDAHEAKTSSQTSLMSVEDVRMSKVDSEDASIAPRVPLSYVMRRKSCCCSECGYMSMFERKHMNLANPSKREEMQRKIAVENLRLLQTMMTKESKEGSAVLEEDQVKEEKSNNDEGNSNKLAEQVDIVFCTEEFNKSKTMEPTLKPSLKTEMGHEGSIILKKRLKSKTLETCYPSTRMQTNRGQEGFSPNGPSVKQTKDNSTMIRAVKTNLSQPTIIARRTEKSSTVTSNVTNVTKSDSPGKIFQENKTSLAIELQQSLQKLRHQQRFKGKQIDGIRTTANSPKNKKNDSSPNSPNGLKILLPNLERNLNLGYSSVKTTLRRKSIKSVYMTPTGSITPKLPFIHTPPLSKEVNGGSENSQKPKIMVTSPNIERKRKTSVLDTHILEKEDVVGSIAKPCITTLETMVFSTPPKVIKTNETVNIQEETEKDEKFEVEGSEKSKRREGKKKSKKHSSEKRSASLGQIVKVYQSHTKIGFQVKK